MLFAVGTAPAYAQLRPANLAPAIWERVRGPIGTYGQTVTEAVANSLLYETYDERTERLGFLYLVNSSRFGRLEAIYIYAVALRFIYRGEVTPAGIEAMRWFASSWPGQIPVVIDRAMEWMTVERYPNARFWAWRYLLARANPLDQASYARWPAATTELHRSLVMSAAARILQASWAGRPEDDVRPVVLQILAKASAEQEFPQSLREAIARLERMEPLRADLAIGLARLTAPRLGDVISFYQRILNRNDVGAALQSVAAQALLVALEQPESRFRVVRPEMWITVQRRLGRYVLENLQTIAPDMATSIAAVLSEDELSELAYRIWTEAPDEVFYEFFSPNGNSRLPVSVNRLLRYLERIPRARVRTAARAIALRASRMASLSGWSDSSRDRLLGLMGSDRVVLDAGEISVWVRRGPRASPAAWMLPRFVRIEPSAAVAALEAEASIYVSNFWFLGLFENLGEDAGVRRLIEARFEALETSMLELFRSRPEETPSWMVALSQARYFDRMASMSIQSAMSIMPRVDLRLVRDEWVPRVAASLDVNFLSVSGRFLSALVRSGPFPDGFLRFLEGLR